MTQMNMFNPEKRNWAPPEVLPNFSHAKIIGVDCETRDPNLNEYGPGGARKDGEVVGISLSDGYKSVYLPFGHEGGGNLDRSLVLRYAKDVLSTTTPKVGTKLLYDLEWLRTLGIECNGKLHDIAIAEALLDENKRGRYSLEAISLEHLGVGKSEEVLRQDADFMGVDPKSGLWQLPSWSVGEYAEIDARNPVLILEKQIELLKDQDLLKIYGLETDLMRPLLEMRFKGVAYNEQGAYDLGQQLQKQEMINRQRLGINPNSNTELTWYCEKNKIEYPRTAIYINKSGNEAGGNPSFTADFLKNSENKFFQQVNDLRVATKMRKDYIDKLLRMCVNGRIHCEFNQFISDDFGTKTGRFSSSNPNLQQIPSRDKFWGPLIKSLFIPDPGQRWCRLDYSQQEPRITIHWAAACGIQSAIEAAQLYITNPDQDFHQMVADMAGISRDMAKGINLGLSYGMGVPKLATMLGLSETDAYELMDLFHAKVPFIRKLQAKCEQAVRMRGCVTTLLGRKRHLNPDIGGHTFLNSLVQGSAADMGKKAMRDLYYDHNIIPLIMVHDEFDLSIAEDSDYEVPQRVMKEAIKVLVPMKVDVEVGSSWGNLTKMKEAA